MALRVAVANGNWSNPATWNAGLIPTTGDIAAANGYTVTIDQDINVARITTTTASPVTATAKMTSYTTPSGKVEANAYVSGREAWIAFDQNNGTIGQLGTTNTGWISYEFPSPIVINAYSFVLSSNENPKNWTFEGWDGSSWIVLHTVVGGPVLSYTSPLIGNNIAYIKYRFNVTETNATTQRSLWYEINLFEKGADLAAVAGGGFTLAGSYNLTLTTSPGIVCGSTNCLTFSGGSGVSASISGTPTNGNTTNDTAAIVHSGLGTLTLTGSISGVGAGTNRRIVVFSGAGILNVVGNVGGNFSTQTFLISGAGICNLVGSVFGGSNVAAIDITGAGSRLNITGNVTGGSNTGRGIFTNAGTSITITGNVSQGSSGVGLSINAANTINITGNVTGGGGYSGIDVGSSNSYLKIIGSLTNAGNSAVNGSSTSAINIFSGPFICQQYGGFPFFVARLFLIPTANSYFEFRNNSTNGALSPGAVAPATYLYSPSTVVNGPSPNNVRFGTVYASGSQTGQMRVPLPSQVSLGIPVDNTTGSAVLTGADIANSVWNKLISEITASNSIGVRLKNVSTPAITGAQLTALG